LESVIQKDDVLVLSDNKSYSVIQTFEYDGQTYIVLIRRTNYDEKNPVVLFARERIEEDDKVLVDVILDEEFVLELSDHLKEISSNNE
jgi:hypothetical protein